MDEDEEEEEGKGLSVVCCLTVRTSVISVAAAVNDAAAKIRKNKTRRGKQNDERCVDGMI